MFSSITYMEMSSASSGTIWMARMRIMLKRRPT